MGAVPEAIGAALVLDYEARKLMANDAIADEFRDAMRRLGGTVAVITAGTDDGWTGMAATAVISVCMDPPTLLVSINQSASIHPVITAQKRFCVNILSQGHSELVGAFSGKRKGLERFEIGDWSAGPNGEPILADALSSLSCQLDRQIDVGTHTLFVGQVDKISNHPAIAPLMWVDGKLAAASFDGF
jgi:flavin reductase